MAEPAVGAREEDEPTCSVCLDALAAEMVTVPKCGHAGHAACLARWGAAQLASRGGGAEPATCPTCRGALPHSHAHEGAPESAEIAELMMAFFLATGAGWRAHLGGRATSATWVESGGRVDVEIDVNAADPPAVLAAFLAAVATETEQRRRSSRAADERRERVGNALGRAAFLVLLPTTLVVAVGMLVVELWRRAVGMLAVELWRRAPAWLKTACLFAAGWSCARAWYAPARAEAAAPQTQLNPFEVQRWTT